MNTIQTIPLNKLVHSKANVRKTGAEEGIAELAASIAAVGLRQNLNVRDTETGRFEVVAGGRRLRALKSLVKEGLLAKDAEIPCRVMTAGEDAAEVSLIENIQRVAMHPDDQFVAFQQLVDAGRSIEDVAARFGVTPAVVERRMKLAKVSPTLRAAFRRNELTLEQMMAFAVSDDHALQEEVHRNLTGFRSSARDIRAALTQEAVALTHPLAKFVTVDAYVAAGGVIQRDLFDTVNEGYMPDRVLVLQLAQAKLAAATETVKAEGWKWVQAEAERDYSVNYGRVYPADHEDGEGSDPTPRFEAEDMARAGAVVRIGHDGELAIERGLVHPDDRIVESGPKEAKKAKEPGDLPATLIRELSAHRTAGLQAAMAFNPKVALAATVTTLALPLFYQKHGASCLDVSLRLTKAADIVRVAEECTAHAVMASEGENWGERLPGKPDELLDWCVAQPQDVLLALLAYCTACSLNVVVERADAASPRLTQAYQLAGHLALDMATQWTPTVEGFYGRMNKATMVALVEEAKAPLTIRLADAKKDTAARHVMEAMAETAWLPALLRAPAAPETDDLPMAAAA